MSVGIFVYGTVVFGLVAIAMGLLVWGILNEGRDRNRPGQTREVFGEATAAYTATGTQRRPDEPGHVKTCS